MTDFATATMDTTSEWGWTSYKRLGWGDKQGRRYYEAHLRSDSPAGYSTCTIRF